MKQVPYLGPQNIWRFRTKLIAMATCVSARLLPCLHPVADGNVILNSTNVLRKELYIS